MKNHKTIHEKFVQLGNKRRKITYELLALLPEIYGKQIYREFGCATICEYAGKFAGLSKSVVQKVLRTDKHLEGKPHLKEAVKSQGIHKVALVARHATNETDAVFADKVENMSKSALQEMSKEIAAKKEAETEVTAYFTH